MPEIAETACPPASGAYSPFPPDREVIAVDVLQWKPRRSAAAVRASVATDAVRWGEAIDTPILAPSDRWCF